MPNKISDKIESGREYRNIKVGGIKPTTDEMIVEGYATTFNEPYTLFSEDGYRYDEQIDAHAFDGTDLSDVIMQYDHEGKVYARTSNDTLELSVDEHGLKVRAYLGGTEAGRQLYSEIKGGYVEKMSFGFTVEEDSTETVNDRSANTVIVTRTILKIKKLYDVSAVSIPANDATEISARNLSEGAIGKVKEEFLERRNKIKQIQILLEV